jgi:1-acyl-sn-glycerol-3-phosphate acyltransferase
MDSKESTECRDAAAGRLRVLLATLGGNLFIVLGSALFGTLAILGSRLPPTGRWVFLMARLWSRGLLWCSGLRLEVEGTLELDNSRSYVFMPNHQSLYDIPSLIATLPVPAFFMAKRSLFRIPIFGWALAAGGFISVDRHDRSNAKQAFARAVASLQAGRSTVIFPEGTRSLDGQLLPFERGGFLMALKSCAAIVPVGIQGTLQVRRRGGWKVTPGTIRIHYGSPVEVEDFSIRTRGDLSTTVRSSIIELAGIED